MKFKKKNSLFGKYPSNDMLNNAIRFLLRSKKDENIESAISEIVYAISKANGYLYDDVMEELLKSEKWRMYFGK